jgi:carboxypeptidase Taq
MYADVMDLARGGGTFLFFSPLDFFGGESHPGRMLPQSTDSRLSELKELDKKINRLGAVKAALEWDQETQLPPAGVEERAEQLAVLEGLIHDLRTGSVMGRLTSELAEATIASTEDRALVRWLRRDFDRATRLPKELVERSARLVGTSQPAWAKARKASDFAAFAPYLEQLVGVAREKAELLGYADHPYDALLEDYEPGTTSAEVKAVFDGLEDGVADLVRRIAVRTQVDSSFLSRRYPREIQEKVVKQVSADIGFDGQAGRLDTSTHPFCTTLGPRDVRITTRYDENFLNMALYGVIHETGHALYEQGVDASFGATALGGGVSLGIHESQSRFWENLIGRSRPFVERYLPRFREAYPESLGDIDADRFYRGINRVEPSFIRVEADEVTYSLHIILRFRLELALLDGSLAARDVPDAWNAEFVRLFGITPPDDAHGCLQDVHWAMGGLGYFPTYTLGNLYAAQFFDTLKTAVPDWDALVTRGEFGPILGWLRTNIHRHGRVYPAGELCQRVTGQGLNPRYFLDYLNAKFGAIYGL